MLKDRVKQARSYANITLDDMAKALNIGRTTLIDYEKGKSEPKVSTVINMSEICTVNEWWLLTGKGSMKEESSPTVSQDAIAVPLISHHAQAGTGNDIAGIRYEIVDTMTISKNLFKTPPTQAVRIIKVEGYSMVPMLYPDTFVIFEEKSTFSVDGLYIINYGNELMVKLLQMDPLGDMHIKSANKEYESWVIKSTDQTHFHIVGKVLRIVI